MWVTHNQIDYWEYAPPPILPIQEFLDSTLIEKDKVTTQFLALELNTMGMYDEVL